MKKQYLVIGILVLAFLLIPTKAFALNSQELTVKNFYRYVDSKQYGKAWNSLTETSKQRITNMIVDKSNEIAKGKATYTYSQIRKMMDQPGSEVSLSFWNSFRGSFKADYILPRAKFKMVSTTSKKSIVKLSLGTKFVNYKLFKEGGVWKVGYTETFKL